VKAKHKQICQNQNIEKLKYNVTFGVIIDGYNPEEEFKNIKDLGFSHCQLNISEYSQELAQLSRSSIKK
jgi:hypothetical protein